MNYIKCVILCTKLNLNILDDNYWIVVNYGLDNWGIMKIDEAIDEGLLNNICF